jgi:hypothetical protein
MEAAWVAARRGHHVTLHEASPSLGGAVRLAAKAPYLAGLADVTHWQESELYRLGVDIRLGSYIDAADLVGSNADVVMVAVGSMPRCDGMQIALPGLTDTGLGHASVSSSWDILNGETPVNRGDRFIVFDDTGHFEATALAEYLLSKGASVDFITRFASLAPLMDFTMRSAAAIVRLNQSGRFQLHPLAYVKKVRVADKALDLGSLAGKPDRVLDYDRAAYVGYNESLGAAFAEQLKALGYNGEIKVIGDALSARYLPGAIHDGFNSGLAA